MGDVTVLQRTQSRARSLIQAKPSSKGMPQKTTKLETTKKGDQQRRSDARTRSVTVAARLSSRW